MKPMHQRAAVLSTLLMLTAACASRSNLSDRPTDSQSTRELLYAEVKTCQWDEPTEELHIQFRLVPTSELRSLGVLPGRIGLGTFDMIARYADGSQSQMTAGGPIEGSQADLTVSGVSKLPTALLMSPVEFTVDTDTILKAQSLQSLSRLSTQTSLGRVVVDSVKVAEGQVTLVLQFSPLSLTPAASMKGTGGVDLRFANGASLVEASESASPVGAALSVLATLSPSPLEESNAQRARGPLKLYIASLAIDYETPISIPLTRCS